MKLKEKKSIIGLVLLIVLIVAISLLFITRKNTTPKNDTDVIKRNISKTIKKEEDTNKENSQKIKEIIEKNKVVSTPANLKTTLITSKNKDKLVIVLEDTLKKEVYGKLRIYSNTEITKVESMNSDMSIKCNIEKQVASCDVLTLEDIVWPFVSISYKKRADNESNIMDFTSSDPQLSFSFGILSTNKNGEFIIDNTKEKLTIQDDNQIE